MTTVITRYFESARDARAAWHELHHSQRLSPRIMEIYESAEGLADALTGARVNPDTARAYEERMRQGGAVLRVDAGYKPLGVAQITRDVTRELGAVDMGDLEEEVWFKDRLTADKSILEDHPLLMTRPLYAPGDRYHMADWPLPLVIRGPKREPSVLKDHPHFVDFAFPLSYKEMMGEEYTPYTKSIFPRHARMADWPIGLLVPHEKRYGRFPFGLLIPGHKFMAKFPFGHIVPGHKFFAKWPIKHLIPGHRHMANWPFPLLINGKQHTNSLVPGHKYMANWPFGHIVPGHKHYADKPIGHLVSHKRRYGRFPFGLLVPGHKFMAKFPFAHIVPGHKHMAKFPFGHIVPGHKYMANWIWPHTKTNPA